MIREVKNMAAKTDAKAPAKKPADTKADPKKAGKDTKCAKKK